MASAPVSPHAESTLTMVMQSGVTLAARISRHRSSASLDRRSLAYADIIELHEKASLSSVPSNISLAMVTSPLTAYPWIIVFQDTRSLTRIPSNTFLASATSPRAT
uniref:Uncharacterized protein n=1 Tax=Arundo donax TaxID=35708 RepID=A0A0A9HD81_ARUDO